MFSDAFLRISCFTRSPRRRPRAADPRFPDPDFSSFSCSVVWLPLCRRFGAKVGPKTPQGTQKGAKREPKSLFLGAQSVTFGGQLGESGPLRKHQYLICFTHIIQASAPAFSHLKSTRERNVHQRRSFSLFYVHFGRQSGAQGRPKGVPRAQKKPQRPPPGHLKISKKLTRGPARAKREPGRLQGCPREGK